MKKDQPQKEDATAQLRIYPSTHKRLKIRAAEAAVSLAEIVEQISNDKK